MNVSFVEETPKEMLSLPKISENYDKAYEKEAKKGQNRFKDIPIDISTKILRSNLREWGAKIRFGNMPGTISTIKGTRPRARASWRTTKKVSCDPMLLFEDSGYPGLRPSGTWSKKDWGTGTAVR